MKKLLMSAVAVGSLFAAPSVADLQKQITDLQTQLKELKKSQVAQDERYTEKVAPMVSNNHLFWSFDLRTTYDSISQTTTSGGGYTTITPNADGTATFSDMGAIPSKKYTNNIFTNRVILSGVAKPADNLKATVRIEANNIFGMNSEAQYSPYNNISWVANETPDDVNIRLKEAFFNYNFGENGEYMFSAGRRPATEGYPANLREGDSPSSPLAHLINMEFDGFSFHISSDAFGSLGENYGTNVKFCLGRGYSTSQGKWPYNGEPANSEDAFKNTDFGGFIIVPYDDGQYSLWTETVWAWNMKGYNVVSTTPDTTGDGYPDTMTVGMQDLGDYFGFNAIFKMDGIGDGINDFLDDTKAFVSFSLSQTKPDAGKQMLGSTDNETGHSVWIGADMPAGEDGRFGVSFVNGSKYWRSMTYGEDTLIGSIAAVRGKAYDVYYNTEIIPHLTANLRYTYINYDYAGSEAFFGMAGDPNNPVYVDTARDIRAYIRYQF